MQEGEAFGGIVDTSGNYEEVHVYASVSKTAEALKKIFNVKSWQKDVYQSDVDLVEPACFIIKQNDHEWSQVLFSQNDTDYQSIAKKISEILNTKTMFFAYNDTAGVIVYELCESGNRLEFLVSCEDIVEFESNLRDLPPIRPNFGEEMDEEYDDDEEFDEDEDYDEDEEFDEDEKDWEEFAEEFFKQQKLLAGSIDYNQLISNSESPNVRTCFRKLGNYEFEQVDFLELEP